MSEAPLAGLRVLAVSQFGAGPFATLALADLGAEVVKIEDARAGGDVSRHVPPFAIDGDSLYFQSLNRGKKSVTLDLAHPEGRAVFHALVAVSDAVYSNLRGDLPERLGLTYAALGPVNPRIVCCTLSGYGTDGPRAAEPGYDPLVQAEAGWMAITGEPDGPPTRSGISAVDFAAGWASIAGLLAGLWHAKRTGRGRDVSVSLLDTALAQLSYMATWSLNRDWEPARVGLSGHQTLVPSGAYPTRDGWLVVFCAKEKFWTALAEGLGLPSLADDPRYRTFADRLAHRDELQALIAPRFRELTTTEWLERLRGRVPAAPVQSVREALADPALEGRGMLVTVEHPDFGALREVGCPIVTEGHRTAPAAGPALGEHTEALLRDLLGYTPERLAALRASGALGSAVRTAATGGEA